MSNIDGSHIIALRNNMYKMKFSLLLYFFSQKGEIHYKLVNLVIYHFFDKQHIIHSEYYVEYFVKSEDFNLETRGDNYIINPLREVGDFQKYEFDLVIINELYDKLSLLKDSRLDKIYYKIF